QPKADAKNTNAKAEPQGASKQMDPKQAEQVGQARGREDPKQKTGDPKLDKTLDEIAKLREQSNSDDQKTRDDAAKALDKMAKGAEDPKARDAAKEALEESKGQGQAKGNPDPKETGQGQAKGQSPDDG